MTKAQKVLCIFILFAGCLSSSAHSEPTTSPVPAPPYTDTEYLRSRSYLGLEMARNYPVSTGRHRFYGGKDYYFLAYRFWLSPEWVLGVFGQFKVLLQKEPDRRVNFLTVGQETNRIIRLNHPFYLGIGAKLLYMTPAEKTMLPVHAISDLKKEFGVSASLQLIYMVNEKWQLIGRIDRWRGTGSMRYHGVESSFGFNYQLPQSR